MNRRPVRLVAIALAAVLGVVTGLWCEQLTGVRQGVDTRISSLTVMPDDRTIVVMAGGHDRVSAVETPTEVRITRHTTWEPFTACFEACDDTSLAVHLHAPLGGRSIVDTSDGASMPPAAQRILRPSAIPTGLVHQYDVGTFDYGPGTTVGWTYVQYYTYRTSWIVIREGRTPALRLQSVTIRGYPGSMDATGVTWYDPGASTMIDIAVVGGSIGDPATMLTTIANSLT